MYKQFIRDKNFNPIGVIFGDNINNEVHIGWSLCRRGDRFDKKRGDSIAIARM
jgi:hypothetical protein